MHEFHRNKGEAEPPLPLNAPGGHIYSSINDKDNNEEDINILERRREKRKERQGVASNSTRNIKNQRKCRTSPDLSSLLKAYLKRLSIKSMTVLFTRCAFSGVVNLTHGFFECLPITLV